MRALTIALAAVFCSVLGFGASAAEPTAIGLWQQVDDKTGEVGGWFLLFEKDGAYQGAIAKTFPKPGEDPNPPCKKCEGDQKNAPSLGLVLIKGMKRNGLKYEKGTILDPRDGKVYNAMMEVSADGKTLTVRGYLGFELLGRSQFWKRLPQEALSEVDPAIIMAYAPGLLPQSPQKTGTTTPHQRSANPGKEKTVDLPADQKAVDAPAQKAAEVPERKAVDGSMQRVIDAPAQRVEEGLPKKAPLPPERPKQ
jgi:uncharacterized protein (DUF2147 family)